jgi:hypothetical protein
VKNWKESAEKMSSDSRGRRMLKTLILKTTALADQAAAVNSKQVIKAFPRFAVGLMLIIWVGPYADFFYTKFDVNARVSAKIWYYESWNWFFLTLGPYLKSIAVLIGIYLILVHKSRILNYVFAFPLTYDVGKILWLVQVSNHDEYNSGFPGGVWKLYGFVTAIFLIVIADLLTYWLNHRVHAIRSRLHGLRNVADKVEPQILVAKFVETMDADTKVKQFQNY